MTTRALTRDEYYQKPVERIVRLHCGDVVKLTTPADLEALNGADRDLVDTLIALVAIFERPPGAHRRSRGPAR